MWNLLEAGVFRSSAPYIFTGGIGETSTSQRRYHYRLVFSIRHEDRCGTSLIGCAFMASFRRVRPMWMDERIVVKYFTPSHETRCDGTSDRLETLLQNILKLNWATDLQLTVWTA